MRLVFKNFYLDNNLDEQIHTTNYLNNNNQVLNKDSKTLVHITQNIISLAPQYPTLNLTPIKNLNFIGVDTMQVRFPRNKSTMATQNDKQNSASFNNVNLDSQHAARVQFTQNQLTLALQNGNSTSKMVIQRQFPLTTLFL